MFQRMLSVCVTLVAFALPAAAQRDIVHFADRIVVPEGQETGDVVCFLCSVEAKAPIQGDVVVFGGNLRLAEPAHGDVVVFAGDVSLSGDASIAGDLVLFGGTLHADTDQRVGGDRVILPRIIFLPILLAIAGAVWGFFLLARWLVRGRQSYYPVPPR